MHLKSRNWDQWCLNHHIQYQRDFITMVKNCRVPDISSTPILIGKIFFGAGAVDERIRTWFYILIFQVTVPQETFSNCIFSTWKEVKLFLFFVLFGLDIIFKLDYLHFSRLQILLLVFLGIGYQQFCGSKCLIWIFSNIH